MIISKVSIDIFRGFKDVDFSLGEFVTLIAGQNGTQKSTLLGILSQTFTIPFSGHAFSNEIPLTGGSFRSAFQDKFRLSPNLDLAGEHKWTLYLKDNKIHPDVDENGKFLIESIPRKHLEKESIRFWQKGKRGAGSGYIQLPVIFLSLKRLIPIAEAGNVVEKDIELTPMEEEWFANNYNRILLSSDTLESVKYIESNNKNTLGVSTSYYDWNSNSAGQDNLGRILLAVISFQRLKEKHPKDYKGGILAIDEIDATLYPASQVKLLESLPAICSDLNLQIIATTHSLHLLEKVTELKSGKGREKQFNTIYLTKMDNRILVEENPSFEKITHNLNVTIGKAVQGKKISIYTEDSECAHFTKALLGRSFNNLNFIDVTLGCGNLIELGKKKVSSFSYPNAIVVLDGDANKALTKARLKNYICLPGLNNPETMLAKFLSDLPDSDPFWKSKNSGYSKQFCFKDFKLSEIKNCRIKAKKWYNQQLETGAWGRQASYVFNCFISSIAQEKKSFVDQFKNIYDSMKTLN
jgi:hypothetical protein